MMEIKPLIIGVTGTIASGKTCLINELIQSLNKNGVTAGLISIDDIRRNILYVSSEELHKILRVDLSKFLGISLLNNGLFDIKEFGKNLFSNKQKMEIFRRIINPVILQEVISQSSTCGYNIIFIEWSMLVEDHMIEVVKGNVIHLGVSKELQFERLFNGGLSIDEQQKRILYTHGIGFNQRNNEILRFQKTTGIGKLFSYPEGCSVQMIRELTKIIHDKYYTHAY